MKRLLTITIIIILIGFNVASFGWLLFGPRMLNKESKDAISRIHTSLQPGGTKDDVVAVFDREKTERLSLITDSFTNTWLISMPFEFGSSDFALYVQFDDENKISSVCMRSSDGVRAKPRRGFPDKGKLDITRL